MLISDNVMLSLRACGQGCVGSKATFARLERRVEDRDCVHGGEVGVVGWESGFDRGTCVIWRRRIGWLGSVRDTFLCRDVSRSASCSPEGGCSDDIRMGSSAMCGGRGQNDARLGDMGIGRIASSPDGIVWSCRSSDMGKLRVTGLIGGVASPGAGRTMVFIQSSQIPEA